MAAPKLIVLSEQFRGKSFELTKPLHTAGRLDERDICIKDPTMSSFHCEFVKDGDSFILRDKGSTNGSRVNNVPVTGEQELHNSDIVQLGGIEMLFDCDDKSVTTVMRTQTGIDLENTDLALNSAPRMTNFNPYGSGGGGGSTHKIIVLVVSLLIIAIVGLLAYIGYTVANSDEKEAINGAQIEVNTEGQE